MLKKEKIGAVSQFIDSLTENVNQLLNANYRCYSALRQISRAVDNGASDTGIGWAHKKLGVMAENRNQLINEIYACFNENYANILNMIRDAKLELYDELQNCEGLQSKNIDDCFTTGQLTDADVINYINAEHKNSLKLFNLVKKYGSALACEILNSDYLEIVKQYENVFDYNGRINNDIEPTTKVFTADSVHLMMFNAENLLKALQKQEAEQLKICIKLSKKVAKNQNDVDLLKEYSNVIMMYEYLKIKVQDAKNFYGMARTFDDRLKASNSTGVDLKNRIFQAVIDFGFGTPQPKIKNKEEIDEIFVGNFEFADIIALAKSFAVNAELLQNLCFENKLTLTMKLKDFELSKLMVAILADQHKTALLKLQGQDVSPEDITPPEVAKCLLFTTPFGTCWFNGENLVESTTGKIIPVSKMERMVYDEANNRFIDYGAGQGQDGGKK